MGLFSWFTEWRRERLLRRFALSDREWQWLREQLPLIHHLTDSEQQNLRRLTALVALEKQFTPVQGQQLSQNDILLIAAQAAIPIIHLGIDWYEGWSEVVVYPSGFLAEQTWQDEAGVIHTERRPLSGESWSRGPVILAWDDVTTSPALDGHNLVIHEFVHKLDWLDGTANGLPPLHRDMQLKQWADALSHAYDHLQQQLERGHRPDIDPYAATSPAEFFAVCSEVYWERPEILRHHYPEVFQQLDRFYRP